MTELKKIVGLALNKSSSCCLDDSKDFAKVLNNVCDEVSSAFILCACDMKSERSIKKAVYDVYAEALVKIRFGIEPNDCDLFDHIGACESLEDVDTIVEWLEEKYGLMRVS